MWRHHHLCRLFQHVCINGGLQNVAHVCTPTNHIEPLGLMFLRRTKQDISASAHFSIHQGKMSYGYDVYGITPSIERTIHRNYQLDYSLLEGPQEWAEGEMITIWEQITHVSLPPSNNPHSPIPSQSHWRLSDFRSQNYSTNGFRREPWKKNCQRTHSMPTNIRVPTYRRDPAKATFWLSVQPSMLTLAGTGGRLIQPPSGFPKITRERIGRSSRNLG